MYHSLLSGPVSDFALVQVYAISANDITSGYIHMASQSCNQRSYPLLDTSGVFRPENNPWNLMESLLLLESYTGPRSYPIGMLVDAEQSSTRPDYFDNSLRSPQ